MERLSYAIEAGLVSEGMIVNDRDSRISYVPNHDAREVLSTEVADVVRRSCGSYAYLAVEMFLEKD